jgi:peptidoglycan/LPS O-acetylase OafA/YrhL
MPAGEQVMERPTTNTSASSPASVVPPSVEYRPALDGLRALAVTAVLAFHLDRLPGGNLGVDAFFVISGWLITWKLLGEVDARGSIDLRRFWTARARRLMPASLGVLVVVSVIWPIAGIAVPSLRRDVMWAALWSSNWGTITGGGDYWARFGDPSPITHFWSLAIEEQFYLVWPVVLLVFARRGASRRTVGFAAAALAALSMTLMVIMADPANPTAVYMNTLARAHSLLAGAAAAAFTITRPSGSIRGGIAARRLLPFASLAAVAIVVLSSHSSWRWSSWWSQPPMAPQPRCSPRHRCAGSRIAATASTCGTGRSSCSSALTARACTVWCSTRSGCWWPWASPTSRTATWRHRSGAARG